jgi:hypothetical protein
MKEVSVLFLLAAVSAVEAQFYIDSVCLSAHQDYSSLKWNCFENIELNFNKAYMSLNSTVFNVIDVYMKQQSLIATCQNFNTTNLKHKKRSMLRRTCQFLTTTFDQSVVRAHGTLMFFFSGLLGSPPELMAVADEMYSAVQDALFNMMPIYTENPNCVGQLLKKFTNIYRKTDNDMAVLYLRVQNSISRIFNDAVIASRIAVNALNSFRDRLENCNDKKENQNTCILELVTFPKHRRTFLSNLIEF